MKRLVTLSLMAVSLVLSSAWAGPCEELAHSEVSKRFSEHLKFEQDGQTYVRALRPEDTVCENRVSKRSGRVSVKCDVFASVEELGAGHMIFTVIEDGECTKAFTAFVSYEE